MEGKAQERGSAADRHLAHLGHELRSPLNAVIGYAEAMRAGVFGPLDSRYAAYAEIIQAAGRHMLALADALLARAGAGSPASVGPFTAFDAAEAVEWAAGLMRLEAESAGVTLACALSPLRVRADRGAIVRMVINLVANAIRFTPAGGTIRVTLRAEAGAASLRVSDTGTGLAPGSERNGLGLALVRELVEAHAGAMTIASERTRGTDVRLALPILESPP